MNALRLKVFALVSLLLIVSGCAQNSSPQLPPPLPDKEAKIKASLEKLDPDDRKLAEEQK